MQTKKLQIALEFMIIFAFVLIVFMVLFVVVSTQRAQTLSSQLFAQEQLVAQNVAAQIDIAFQAGNGYSARIPITGSIGTLAYQLLVTKNGAVIVNASVGKQLLQAVSYTTVKNIASNPAYLQTNTVYYNLPIANGTITIQNSFGNICIDVQCPTTSKQSGNITLTSQVSHAALLTGQGSYLQGHANDIVFGTNALSIFAWVRTQSPSQGVVFSYGNPSVSGQFVSLQESSNGNFIVNFGGSNLDSKVAINDGQWHLIGFASTGGGGGQTITLYTDKRSTSTSPSYTIKINTDYYIGRESLASACANTACSFNGAITNVQEYNGSLSAGQAFGLYNSGIAASPVANTVSGWWPLNGNGNDYSGNGNNANSVGSVIFPAVVELFAGTKNQQGYPLANALVGFETTRGNFTTSQVATNYTNANGIAVAFLTQKQNSGQATVRATVYNANQSTQGNLIGWWPLGLGQGGFAYDLSGNPDNGIFKGYTGWSNPNYVASFSNVYSYVRVPTSATLHPAQQSWSFWFYSSALAPSQRIFGIGNPTALPPTGIEAYVTSNEALGFNALTQSCNSVTPLSNNTWYYAAATWDGANFKCYLNGMLQNSISSGFSGSLSSSNAIYTGTDSFTPATYTFTGSIADMQMYNIALAPNQVMQLYDQGIGSDPVTAANAVGWWPLDGNANDYSGNGNNGTVYGNVNFFSAPINDSVGNNATSVLAANFNGVNSVITTPINKNALLAFSLAMWIDPANTAKISSIDGYTVFNSFGTNNFQMWLSNGVALGAIPGQGNEEVGIGSNVYNGYGINGNSWNFLAVVLASGRLSFYANGAPPYNISIPLGTFSINSLATAQAAKAITAFNGLLANVQLYNQSLSASQVFQIYRQGLAGTPINNNTNPNINLMAWWPLNGNANDYSGVGNNGTTKNVIYVSQPSIVQTVPQMFGGTGANFNGQSSYINPGTTVSLRPTNAVTVNLWMSFNGTSQNGASLLDDGPNSCAGCGGYGLYFIGTNTAPTFAISDGTSRYKVTSSVRVPYGWHMITGVYNGINMSIYVDGASTGTISHPGNIVYSSPCSGIAGFCNVTIGDTSINSAKFAGAISDVQIYKLGLSTSQIQNLYGSQTPQSATAVVPLSWLP